MSVMSEATATIGAVDDLSPEIHICGIVVHAQPEKIVELEPQLKQVEGVDIHASDEAGKLVVTVEGKEYRETVDKVTEIHNLPGVLSVSLVYQHAETEE